MKYRHYDHIPCAVVALNPDTGRIVYANRDGAAVLSATPAEHWRALATHRRELVAIGGRWYVTTAWPVGGGMLCALRDVTETLQLNASRMLAGTACRAPRGDDLPVEVAALIMSGKSIADICAALQWRPSRVVGALMQVTGVPLR